MTHSELQDVDITFNPSNGSIIIFYCYTTDSEYRHIESTIDHFEEYLKADYPDIVADNSFFALDGRMFNIESYLKNRNRDAEFFYFERLINNKHETTGNS